MKSEIIFEVEEAPEGGYTAQALGYAIVTEGDSLEELREMVIEAVLAHFDRDDLPEAIRLRIIKDEVIPV